jgi:hypothetical protein
MIESFKEWNNKTGTSDRICDCGSWSQHWLNYSNSGWPRACAVEGCLAWPTLGAHVFSQTDRDEYIVPLCSSHNNMQVSFSLKSSALPVSANRSKTCDVKK